MLSGDRAAGSDQLVRWPVEQAQVGMYVARVEGSWLQHPFWKSSFRIMNAEELAALRESGVSAVWIDPARSAAADTEGDDVPAAEAPAGEPAAAPPPSPVSERERAAEIVARAKEAVRGIFAEARLGGRVELATVVPLVEEISASVTRDASALITLTRLKSKDEYTYLHSVAVCALMIRFAKSLGLDKATVRDAGVAGLVHDIGKIAVPASILNKNGGLSAREFEVVRSHPERGHEMLQRIDGIPEAALEVCLHHHEKADGSGYPHGLTGRNIEFMARMGAICDVYDAVTSRRPYKEAWNPAEAISRMYQWKGHFDEALLTKFIRVIGIYPTGSVVGLESGLLAIVVEQNEASLTRPVVRAFRCTRTGRDVKPFDIDLAARGCSDRIVAREPGEQDNSLVRLSARLLSLPAAA
ncbi:MAG: HD-GYP domain-containing protein [Allosphingosinicella sp.]